MNKEILARIKRTHDEYLDCSLGRVVVDASDEELERWHWMAVAVGRVLSEVEGIIRRAG